MRQLLEGWGCKVSTFSGSKALASRGPGQAPDIILADYHLDGETGLDLIRSLRMRYGGSTPAVLVTADRTNEVRAAAEATDVQLINKPLKPAVLRAIMTRAQRMAVAAAE